MQKTIRGYLVKKKHGPRIKGVKKIRGLDAKLKQLENVANQLKKDKDSSMKEIMNLNNEMQTSIAKIKKDFHIKAIEVDKIYEQLVNKVNNQMNSLQKKVQDQKIAEEQDRLRKIQEEMEKERRRKEEEERRLREEEEIRKKKVEIEARRKVEEEVRKKQVSFVLYF